MKSSSSVNGSYILIVHLQEVADVLVINRADLEGADKLKLSLEIMLGMQSRPAVGWQPRIILPEAARDKGTDEVAEGLLRHREFLTSSGELGKRRQQRARLELLWAVGSYLKTRIEKMDPDRLARLVDDLAQRKTNPRTAAAKIITEFSSGG